MTLIDLDSFEAPKGNGGKVVFVRAKACPLTFKPVGGLLSYKSVYDPSLKRNRKPQPSDTKVATRYLINGLTPDGEVKAYDLGATIVEAIKGVRTSVTALGLNPNLYITITAKGAGTDTSYSAAPATGITKEKNAATISADKLLDLNEIVKTIVKEDARQEEPVASGVGAEVDADSPWSQNS
jgi:hypothetical protein